ncbi:alpha/beta hydrolase [Microbispora sp. RL4-1S]|uniref:Alpha/beta hydrolase n=1 Tax=Microbispora oryzae TaxID=2806554 RepID=A0A941AMC9_9ACTN|nr:alpha/beta hydrolase [Microbispora oryzae]MBP2707188.1 alpha/beta hydrolase [Microbispora oryzae]
MTNRGPKTCSPCSSHAARTARPRAGSSCWIFTRQEDRDEPTDLFTRDAQLTAISAWGVPDESRLIRLAAISQPTLVANGENDLMVPTENTHLLGEVLPNSRVVIYPDAGHGFLFQYPAEFADEVNDFLDH